MGNRFKIIQKSTFTQQQVIDILTKENFKYYVSL